MRPLALVIAVALTGAAIPSLAVAASNTGTVAGVVQQKPPLALTEAQRQLFYRNVQSVVGEALAANPGGGRTVIDSAVSVVIRETGRKMKFLRQARLLFSEMFARRSGDDDRASGTEEELWRSSRNVAGLIDLYRKNPDASDAELERAMAPAFRVSH